MSVEDRHQAARIAIRERSKQHAVHDGENTRRRADAERECQSGEKAECGLTPQEPTRMTHVPKPQAHRHLLDGRADERPAICLMSGQPGRLTARRSTYSARSADVGSIRAARQAGQPTATKATIATSATTPAMVRPSSGVT